MLWRKPPLSPGLPPFLLFPGSRDRGATQRSHHQQRGFLLHPLPVPDYRDSWCLRRVDQTTHSLRGARTGRRFRPSRRLPEQTMGCPTFRIHSHRALNLEKRSRGTPEISGQLVTRNYLTTTTGLLYFDPSGSECGDCRHILCATKIRRRSHHLGSRRTSIVSDACGSTPIPTSAIAASHTSTSVHSL